MRYLVLLGFLLGDVDHAALRRIPCAERIAYVNRIADRAGAGNVAAQYVAAAEAYREVFQVGEVEPYATYDEARRAFADDLEVLALTADWSNTEAEWARKWLAANAATLAALREATNGARYHVVWQADTGRLSDVQLPLAGIRVLGFQ